MRLIQQGNFIGMPRGSFREKKDIGFVNLNRTVRYKKWCGGWFNKPEMFYAMLRRLFQNKKV